MPAPRVSRALWDEARRPGAPRTALLRAILYELQPIRFSAIDVAALTASLRSSVNFVVSFLWTTIPFVTKSLVQGFMGLTRKEWTVIFGVVAYLYAVRYLHRVLDAGPMVIILSALVAIFTVGLGDNEVGNRTVSAYSVFNRGFQRIMGSVDVEALVAQHVGGAMALQGLGAREHREHDENLMEDRRPERLNGNMGAAAAANGVAAAPRDAPPDNQQPRNQRGGRGRRSGKKARRRNLEQRREMQRQRQAAAAMGFAGDGVRWNEAEAMNRLVEDQAAGVRADGGEEEDFGIELQEAGFDG